MFEENTYEVILQRLLDRIPDTFDKREGAIIYDALAPAAIELHLIYIALDRFLKQPFADTADREYLIRQAWERDVHPHAARAAVWKGRFEPSTLELPEGARFNYEDLNFSITEKLEDGIYQLTCETAGSVGNNCIGQLIPINYISGLQKAELVELLAEGTDEEETESLRDRYLTLLRKPATSGNVYDYYNWAMACDGVGAVKIFPLANGPGTVKVVIADADKTGATEELCAEVAAYIEERRPIGAAVSVVSAIELPVSVRASVKLAKDYNLGRVQSAFRETLTDYLEKNAFDLAYIGPARIGYLLMETEGIEDYAGLQINGKDTVISLLDEQIAVAGEIVLEVMR
ncbi:MAG: baseplate J/gp47 family protein [Eubacteriales bacterium]|nr:baseplate J/gp47 family protein [Eubacteriales bacterium]